MKWFADRSEVGFFEAGDPSEPPTGGRFKLLVLGAVVPLLILWYGINGFLTAQIGMYGRNANVELYGPPAQALSVAWISIALVCHFRWVWD